MARRMSDDEVEDYAYSKIFGDLDGIRANSSGSDFSKSEGAIHGTADNAGTPGVEGINITVKPLMAAAAESGRPPQGEDEKEDNLKGISKMSPMMERLHGNR